MKKSKRLPSDEQVSSHFRRCHICGSTNYMEDSEVSKCEKCEKSFAPFFYFEDHQTPVLSDNTLRPEVLEGEFYPVRGLTAFWRS